jgi:hypothetical protein
MPADNQSENEHLGQINRAKGWLIGIVVVAIWFTTLWAIGAFSINSAKQQEGTDIVSADQLRGSAEQAGLHSTGGQVTLDRIQLGYAIMGCDTSCSDSQFGKRNVAGKCEAPRATYVIINNIRDAVRVTVDCTLIGADGKSLGRWMLLRKDQFTY